VKPRALNPILDVSDFRQSVEWLKKLGWEEAWSWGDPQTFGPEGDETAVREN
jgi:hypothetical protein